ncbi:hypothetical protein IW262DRAFT_1299097 [Armillaria fumosa]|nr:hypothetical protein IW262DRAFT_1299097 [Armillaria fumosa]
MFTHAATKQRNKTGMNIHHRDITQTTGNFRSTECAPISAPSAGFQNPIGSAICASSQEVHRHWRDDVNHKTWSSNWRIIPSQHHESPSNMSERTVFLKASVSNSPNNTEKRDTFQRSRSEKWGRRHVRDGGKEETSYLDLTSDQKSE